MKALMNKLNVDRLWRDVVVLSLLTMLVLAAFWTLLPNRWQENQNFDFTCCYEPVARNFLAGRGFLQDNGRFGSGYPPGFSLLLAGVFSAGEWIGEAEAMRLYIGIFVLATVLALYALGRAVGGFWLGRVAGVIVLGYPFFLWLAKQPNSETPFIPFLVLMFYSYVRLVHADALSNSMWRWAAACGFFAALASLVRPIAIFSGLSLALCALFMLRERVSWMKRCALVAVVAGVNLVTVLPWELKVRTEIGRWVLLSTNGGVGFLEGVTFGLGSKDLKPVAVSADVLELMRRGELNKDRVQSVGGLFGFLAGEAKDHPAGFAKFMWIKITRVWYATHEGYQEMRTMLVQGLFTLMALFGIWSLRKRDPATATGLVVFTLYFWAMASLVLPLLRYMVPVTVVLMVPIGVTLLVAVRRLGWIEAGTEGSLRSMAAHSGK